jgi:integrase
MPTFKDCIPTYRKHRASGQAVVTLNGRDCYLGVHGTKASRAEYDRVIGEWLAAGRQLAAVDAASDLTITEVLARYWRFAEHNYRKDGRPTQEVINIRYALRPLKELYGPTLARDFGPLALKAIQQRFIRDRICRDQINQRVGKIKRMFKWAVSEQLIPPSVFQALETVVGLRAGRTEAKETAPVLPVEDAVVDATLPYLPPVVADMVRFQRFTGCRPGELCAIRPCDVDTSDAEVWVYRPQSHKTQHHGRERRIFIGPQAQDVLRPYLLREKTALCFTPAESEQKRRALVHEARRTPLHYGNRPGTNRSRKPKRPAGDSDMKDSYNRALRRAVDKANDARRKAAREAGADSGAIPLVPRWHANQLRHTAATKLRSRFGLEAARTVLGHAVPKITLTYAEADFAKAAEAMKLVG